MVVQCCTNGIVKDGVGLFSAEIMSIHASAVVSHIIIIMSKTGLFRLLYFYRRHRACSSFSSFNVVVPLRATK